MTSLLLVLLLLVLGAGLGAFALGSAMGQSKALRREEGSGEDEILYTSCESCPDSCVCFPNLGRCSDCSGCCFECPRRTHCSKFARNEA